ncbi:FecR family protein [Chitinophaga lutea]|uniref:FecR family protein n=1 Tax=Chitinophaga lutea TaxID=2488634 RepID=A0A3N4PNS3_9BACT|nr:FecR family protein [Chitinophaga lutea]RPE09258.1 FecR family protein [Chitinophaga lutea]
MRVSEDIINRFLNGGSSEKEKAIVRAFFLEHPQELEKYLTEESWNGFQAADHLTAADSEKMLHAIEELTYHRRWNRPVIFIRLAAAAVLLLAAGSGFYFLGRPPAQETLAATAEPIPEEEVVNSTARMMRITLPDSTVAELQPAARLHYRRPFGETDREVHLQGKALFHVKSNAGKPFTVFAGRLGTTALGTVFSVDEGNGKVWVQLVSGKVVVRPAAATGKPVYLKPGDKLYYDALRQTVRLEPLKPKPAVAPPAVEEVAAAAPAAVLLEFSNEPLTGLFKTIEAQYGMKVRYEKGSLDNMYFTGVFNSEKESLPDFLNTIALLNNVTIRIDNKTIHITP